MPGLMPRCRIDEGRRGCRTGPALQCRPGAGRDPYPQGKIVTKVVSQSSLRKVSAVWIPACAGTTERPVHAVCATATRRFGDLLRPNIAEDFPVNAAST